MSDRIPPHLLILSGLLLFGFSCYLMTAVDTSTEFWSFAGWVVVGRIGLGLILPSLNVGALRVLESSIAASTALEKSTGATGVIATI